MYCQLNTGVARIHPEYINVPLLPREIDFNGWHAQKFLKASSSSCEMGESQIRTAGLCPSWVLNMVVTADVTKNGGVTVQTHEAARAGGLPSIK